MEKLLAKFKGENSKKQIENIVIFIVLLVIVIIVINSLFTDNDVEEGNVNKNAVVVASTDAGIDSLEIKLKKILSSINGVGNVDVMISYSNTVENIPMYDIRENTTLVEEVDANGGKRKTTEVQNEQNIIYEEKSNNKAPAIKETIMPKVLGVIVVAEGANNSVVKENIKNAVEAVFDIPSHRIQVFSK